MFRKTSQFLYSYNFYSIGLFFLMVIFAWQLYFMFGDFLQAMTCPVKNLTGIPCPTCGSTGFGMALLAGKPGQAFFYNPLFFLAGCVLIVNTFIAVWFTIRKNFVVLSIPAKWQTVLRVGVVVFVALNWIYEWLIYPLIGL